MNNIQVDLQIACEARDLPSRADFTRWVKTVLEQQKRAGEVCIRIVCAEESRALNRTYRDRDTPTNVLSFPFEVPPGIPLSLLGDLVICAEVVAAQARQHFGHALPQCVGHHQMPHHAAIDRNCDHY